MSYLLILGLLFAQAEPDLSPAVPDAAAKSSANTPGSKSAEPTDTADESAADSKAAEKSEDDADSEDTDEEGGSGFFGVLDEILSSGAIGLLRKGGWFMWPILLMGIIATGVIIERYRSLKMLTTDSTAVRSEVRNLLQSDRLEDALAVCENEQGPVPAILSAGVRKFLVLRRLKYDASRVEEQVVKAMDDYGVHVVAALERHLPVLATVSSVAPMLGFLGTVAGMITSFDDIVAQMGETNIVEAAAGGISEALLTTCFGLIIGIPAFIAFNYFTSIINRFVLEVEESATELIEVVTLHMALEVQEPSEMAAT